MKNALLSACTAIVLIMGARTASADDDHYYSNRYYYNGYYDDRYSDDGSGYYNNYGNGGGYYDNYDSGYYDNYGNGGYDNGTGNYGNGGYGYSNDIVSPRSIVQDLRYQGFSYISWPALAGRFYQVKARDPNGHKVKLYIDAYSGRIVKVKG
jgi:hypothetical protein